MRTRIAALSVHRVQIPIGGTFEHAAGKRSSSDSFICVVELDNGVCGYGEGVARPYVTGETPEDCWTTLSQLELPAFIRRSNMNEVAHFAESVVREAILDSDGVIRNGCRSSLEVAILDAHARCLGVSLTGFVSKYVGTKPDAVCPHTLTVGRQFPGPREDFRQLLDTYGFTAAKIKVGFGFDEDIQRVRMVRDTMGAHADLRLDANRAWSPHEAIAFMEAVRGLGIVAVEDPIQGPDIESQAEALRSLRGKGVEIILDEPVRTLAEAETAVRSKAVDVFNIRVSKNGGLLGSLRIAELAQRESVGIQVGCQVAETAILSAAGRCVAYAAGPVRYMEGSNEQLKYLPEQYLCSEDLTYGTDACSERLTGPGLGITVSREQIERFSVQSVRLSPTEEGRF